MSTKVFITGIGGFIGSHLSEFLARQGFEVWGSYFRPTNDMSVPRQHAKGLFNIDLRQRDHLEYCSSARNLPFGGSELSHGFLQTT